MDRGKLASVRTTEWALEQWGRWAYHNRGLSISWSGVEPFERLRGSTLPEPMIADDEGVALDRLVSELCQEYRVAGEALALYFLVAGSYRRLGRILGKQDKVAAALVREGTMWIDGRLRGEGLTSAAERG